MNELDKVISTLAHGHDKGWNWDAPLSKRTYFINVDAWIDALVFVVCLFGFYALVGN